MTIQKLKKSSPVFYQCRSKTSCSPMNIIHFVSKSQDKPSRIISDCLCWDAFYFHSPMNMIQPMSISLYWSVISQYRSEIWLAVIQTIWIMNVISICYSILLLLRVLMIDLKDKIIKLDQSFHIACVASMRSQIFFNRL